MKSRDAFNDARDAPGLDAARRRRLARAACRIALAEATGADPSPMASFVAAELSGCDPPTATAFVRWAEAEGLSALLAPSLRPRVGPEVAGGLSDTARRVAERADVLAADRTRLAAALRAAGVPWRPLKGAWLADHAYPAATLRPMADTDIWVPPAYAQTAHAVINALGYRRSAVSWKHAAYARPDDHVVDGRGEHPDNPRPIDVHPRLLEGFRGIMFDIGARAESAATDRGDDGLETAYMLMHVAAHATVDALGRRLRLLSLVDVAVLSLAVSETGWRHLCDAACDSHAARFVWPSLALAARDLGARIPVAALDALAAGVRAPLCGWLDGVDLDAVTRPGGATATRSLLEVPRIWPLDARERWTVLRWVAWPPRAALADRYPGHLTSSRWPLVYGLHLLDTWRVAKRRWRQRR